MKLEGQIRTIQDAGNNVLLVIEVRRLNAPDMPDLQDNNNESHERRMALYESRMVAFKEQEQALLGIGLRNVRVEWE